MDKMNENVSCNSFKKFIKNPINIFLLSVVAVFGSFAPNLQAETLNLNTTAFSQPPNYFQSVYYNGGNQSEFIGIIGGHIGGVSSQFFCFDVNQSVSLNTNYSVMAVNASYAGLPGLMGATPAIAGATQADKTLRIEQAASVLQSQLGVVANNNAASAGMQLAIWSILYNNTIPTDIGSGSEFRTNGAVNSAVLPYANQFLALANNFSAPQLSDYDQIPFYVYLNGSGQITAGTQILAGVPVPEPGTYLTMASFMGLIGLCAYRKNIGLKFMG